MKSHRSLNIQSLQKKIREAVAFQKPKTSPVESTMRENRKKIRQLTLSDVSQMQAELSGDHSKYIDQNVLVVLADLLKQVPPPKAHSIQRLSEYDRLLVARTANMKVLDRFIEDLSRVSPKTQLVIITHKKDISAVLNRHSRYVSKIISYPKLEMYRSQVLEDLLENEVKNVRLDASVVLDASISGIGLDITHVTSVIKRLIVAPLYVYNNSGQLICLNEIGKLKESPEFKFIQGLVDRYFS